MKHTEPELLARMLVALERIACALERAHPLMPDVSDPSAQALPGAVVTRGQAVQQVVPWVWLHPVDAAPEKTKAVPSVRRIELKLSGSHYLTGYPTAISFPDKPWVRGRLYANHGLTAEEVNRHGGLSWGEMVAVAENVAFIPEHSTDGITGPKVDKILADRLLAQLDKAA